jgi:hypothetical protein
LCIFVEILKTTDMKVKVEHGKSTWIWGGELGKEVITVSVYHQTWNDGEISAKESEKQKEVSDKIAELLKTIEL